MPAHYRVVSQPSLSSHILGQTAVVAYPMKSFDIFAIVRLLMLASLSRNISLAEVVELGIDGYGWDRSSALRWTSFSLQGNDTDISWCLISRAVGSNPNRTHEQGIHALEVLGPKRGCY